MNTPTTRDLRASSDRPAIRPLLIGLLLAAAGGPLACCTESVGHTKTTEKRVTDTPTEKTTTTETHEKNTTITPR